MTTAELERLTKTPEQTIADLVAETTRLRRLHEVWQAQYLASERAHGGKDDNMQSVAGLLGVIRGERVTEDEAAEWYRRYVVNREEF